MLQSKVDSTGAGFLNANIYKSGLVDPDEDNFFPYEGNGPWWQCMPEACVEPRVSKAGLAGPGVPAITLPKAMKMAAEKNGDKPAMKVERPVPAEAPRGTPPPPSMPDDEWTTWTHQQMLDETRKVAAGFVQLGFNQFDSVNVWGFNSPEWVMSALAASWAGGKVAGLYPTDTDETAAYKVVHSGGSIIVVEKEDKIERLVKALAERKDATKIKAFVTWGAAPAENTTKKVEGCGDVKVISWAELLKIGEAGLDEVDKRAEALKPGHCAAIIYTSGTTGEPKAVMISHDNIIYESCAVMELLKEQGVATTACQERLLSFLPQSHVAGMMVDIVVPVMGTAISPAYFTLYFARPSDLKCGTIGDRLKACKPTVFLGVPLVWEKIADKIRAKGAEATGLKKSIAMWAKGVGLAHAKNCQLGESGSYPVGYWLSNKLVLSNVKGLLGLDECKFGFTGAAPIRVDTLEFFGALGLQINEVYGMSECTGACTWSTDACHLWGSCGFEMPGIQVRAFQIDASGKKTECERAPSLEDRDEKYQGELCFRGRNIMMGYMAQPAFGSAHVAEIEKKNKETIDEEGWLHSGDKGMISVQGMVKITGRYKELIIGEGGENIAPVPIEDCVKKACDGIAEIMMVGDKRKYNVALVTLKAVGANGDEPGEDELDAGAKRVNPEVTKISQAMDDKVWIDAITAAIEEANKNGKVCPNNAFKIQKFSILPTNFCCNNNQLTPTRKLKRKVVEDEFKQIIDKMYATDGKYIRFDK